MKLHGDYLTGPQLLNLHDFTLDLFSLSWGGGWHTAGTLPALLTNSVKREACAIASHMPCW